MQVQLGQATSQIGEIQPNAGDGKGVPRVQPQQTGSSVEKEISVQTQESVQAASAPPDVIFRRDQNGRIYYIVTDATSGKELREVPAKVVRNVGEGIAEFLKQEETKISSHIEVKA